MSAKAKTPAGQPGLSQSSGQGLTSHNDTPAISPAATQSRPLWSHIYGDTPGYISLFSGFRVEGQRDLQKPHVRHYAWPVEADKAVTWLEGKAAEGREVYQCAHLITPDGNDNPQRIKKQAALVKALYVDGDGATVPENLPAPSAVVRSSPGREQFFWQLTHAIEPARAEQLNKRLAYAMEADKSGWDLTQLLRVPGTPNRKYPDAPAVQLVMIDDNQAYDPDELERTLPDAPAGGTVTSFATSPDDPPVRLSGDALDWWTGKRQTANRSDTLWAIAKDLARAGAMPHTIAAALQDRDERFHSEPKYPDRPALYLETAIKATSAVMEEARPATITNLPPAGESLGGKTIDTTCTARCTELEKEIKRLKVVENLFSMQWQVISNPELSATQKIVAMATLNVIQSAPKERVDENGRVATWRAEIARRAGVTEETVSRTHKGILADTGLFELDVETVKVEKVNQETGEIHEFPTQQWYIRATAEPVEMLERMREYVKPESAPKHGGRRTKIVRTTPPATCPEHPDAGTYWIGHCLECERQVDQYWEMPETEEAIQRHHERADARKNPAKYTLETPSRQVVAMAEPNTTSVDSSYIRQVVAMEPNETPSRQDAVTHRMAPWRKREPYPGEVWNPYLHTAAGGSHD